MIIGHCINCESDIDNASDNYKNGIVDFCSQACADEYVASCDPQILERAREANPDALPIKEKILSFPQRTGELPPNTLAAVQSILNMGGVSKEDIEKVISVKPEEDNKQ